MVRIKYFRASIILVAMIAATLVGMLGAQKSAEGVEGSDGLCISRDCPPETEITYGPNNGSTTNITTASFEFKGTDDVTWTTNLRFECRLDSTSASDWTT